MIKKRSENIYINRDTDMQSLEREEKMVNS
jgi:hypothetical protein